MTELEQQIQEILKDSDIFTLKDVFDVNHKPHRYVIGGNHIRYVADHHGGMLSDSAIEEGEKYGKLKCEHFRCMLPYKEHKSDKVCFLQLKRTCTKDEAQKELKSIVDACGEKAFDGFGFVETDEKFRII